MSDLADVAGGRRELVGAVAFAALALVTAVPFGSAYAAHVTRFAMMATDVRVGDVAVDGGELRVDLAVRNPGWRTATLFGAQVYGIVDGDPVTDITATEAPETVVESGETAVIPARVATIEHREEELRAALAAGELTVTGQLSFRVADSSVTTSFRAEGVGG